MAYLQDSGLPQTTVDGLLPLGLDNSLSADETEFLDYLIANPSIASYVVALPFNNDGVLKQEVRPFLNTLEQYHSKVRDAVLQMSDFAADFELSDSRVSLLERTTQAFEGFKDVPNLIADMPFESVAAVLSMGDFYDPLSDDSNNYLEERLEDVMTEAGVPEGCVYCDGQTWPNVFRISKAPFNSDKWKEETKQFREERQAYVDLIRSPEVKHRELLKRLVHFTNVNDLLPRSVFELPQEEQDLLFNYGSENVIVNGSIGYARDMLPLLSTWEAPDGSIRNIFQHAHAKANDPSLRSRSNVDPALI